MGQQASEGLPLCTAAQVLAVSQQGMRGRAEPVTISLPNLAWQGCDRRRGIIAADLRHHMCIAPLHMQIWILVLAFLYVQEQD